MAQHVNTPSDLPGGHPTHAGPTVRGYLAIGAILFVITLIEIAASFLTTFGFPEWVQVVVLLAFSLLKGALVVMFFMHLRFDSRWFSFFFVSGMILATLCIVTFLLLFTYKANLVALAAGGLLS